MVETHDRRNTLMGILALLAAALLVAAAVRAYRVFSYLAIGLLVGSIGVASIERNRSELSVAPYNGLVVGWAAVFVAGFTGIWLLWNPSVTSYSYVLGLPTPTLVYVVCLWLLPILGAFYYAFVFPEIGDDDVVDDIMDDAREAQRDRNLPLAPRVGTDGGEDE
ncbi:hypothetical protein [Halogranum rubrum]|uniref:hypothetical protein n=1 Tax=Halogranum rubrum TaxID=553466 RepID=UPI001ED9507B|nr:hypothetical protein [Halogranum salarium]